MPVRSREVRLEFYSTLRHIGSECLRKKSNTRIRFRRQSTTLMFIKREISSDCGISKLGWLTISGY